MKKGEIWRVRLPHLPGHGQSGDRPAIIVQNDTQISSLPTVVIVPLTGSSAANRFPCTIEIPPEASNGLTVPSVALAFQIRALDKSYFLSKMGTISQLQLDQVLALIEQLVK